MSRRLRGWLVPGFILAVLLSVGGVFSLTSVTAEDAPDYLEVGDVNFDEKSYRRAYEAYEQYLKANPDSENRFRVLLRMGHCQIQLEDFDKAEEALVALADSEGLSELERARANYRLGYMYLERPTVVYENHEGERQWGRWMQNSRAIQMGRRNAESAHERLGKADELMRPIALDALKGFADDPARALTLFEEGFNMGLDAAAALQSLQQFRGTERRSFDYLDRNNNKHTWWFNERLYPDRDELTKHYESLSAYGKQGQTTAESVADVRELREQADALRARGRNMAALSLYRAGQFLVSAAHIDDHNFNMLIRVREGSDYDPLAGEHSPLPWFERVYAEFPDSEYADHALFFTGYVHEQAGQYDKAIAAYQRLIEDERYAGRREVSSARAAVEGLTRKRLTVRTLVSDSEIESSHSEHLFPNGSHWRWNESVGTSRSVFMPGEHIGLWVESRNAKTQTVRALGFDLTGFMRDPEFLNAEAPGFNQLGHSALTDVVRRYTRDKVFEAELPAHDSGKHLFNRNQFELPETLKPGAYLVEVDLGDVVDRRVIVVSDLQIVAVSHNEGTTQFLVMDARTGEPVANPRITYKRWGSTWSGNRTRWFIHHGTHTGDDTGRALLPVGRQFSGYLALAEVDGRYTFAQSGFAGWQRNPSGAGVVERFYNLTDRPVYRPGHTMYGKSIVRARIDGEWTNRRNAAYRVRINDPRGEQHFDRLLRVTEFGALEYELEIPEGAPLGNWSVRIEQAGGGWVSSGSFVVEEYRQPELEVKVSPPDEPVRLGNNISARISAEYYFGGAAIDAEVTYRVYRTFYRHRVTFPRRFDWLYNIQRTQFYGTADQQFRASTRRELVTRGDGRLNENGELLIEWSTQEALKEWGDFDHNYIVEATVTDSSRRAVNGSGEVKALRNAFFAFVDNKRGYYREGDGLSLEVRAEDAEGRPVATKGRLEFHRVTFTHERDETGLPQITEHKELVESHELGTDEHGRAFWREKITDAGTYDAVYVTQDPWGNEIRGVRRLVVRAQQWMPGSFNFGRLSVMPHEDVYVKGETARVLIASDIPDSWMLISVVGGHTVLEQHYVGLGATGGQFELELPVTRRLLPNFHVHVLTVRDGEIHTDTVELFVPPDDQFLDVELTSDKDVYQPGESGEVTVIARDHEGNPVEAEFAITIYDRAIQYIVPENFPNIISHFYRDRRSMRMSVFNSFRTSVSSTQLQRRQPETIRHYGAPIGFGVRNWISFERTLFDFDAEVQDRSERFRAAFGGKFARDGEEHVYGQGGFAQRRARGGASGGRAMDGAPPAPRSAEAESPEADSWGGEGERLEESLRSLAQDAADGEEEKSHATPRIRRDFRDSAFYSHRVRTGADGKATVTVEFPDNLTDWRMAARGITRVAKVGEAFHSARTAKRLLLRDQAPRFVVEGDVVTLSGIIMNRYETDLEVRAMLMLNPKDTATQAEIQAFSSYELFPETPDVQVVTVPAGGEYRVDWRVRMTGAGLFKIRMLALSAVESDATERTYDCKVRGAEMIQAHAGLIREQDDSQSFTFTLPEQMDPTQTYMDLQLSPSIAALAMDALPYLLEFPYGCVEQTMSRFLPAVLVRHTLQDAGVSLEDVGRRRMQLDYEGVNPQAAYWYRRNPVFDTATMESILAEGLRRIGIMQRHDGGWGWWRGSQADIYMTAYVVYGLQMAVNAGIDVDSGMFERGVNFLKSHARGERNLHRAAYAAYSLAHAGGADKELLDKLYERRDDLNHQTRAMLAMAQHLSDDKERAQVLLRNIEDYRREDLSAGTVWWDGGRQYWHWWNDRIETNAFVLRAFTMIDPTNQYLERHVRWLTQNRKGSRWNSTKDTSHAVSALMAYARVSGELESNYTVDVKVDGELIHQWQVTPDNIFTLQTNLRLRGEQLPPGEHNFTITRNGNGRVYYSAHVTYFSKEDRLEATGNHISIRREYHRLIETTREVTVRHRNPDGTFREVQETRLAYDRVPLEYGEELKSGDLIEVSLNIRADNDYEYLMFEDFKPAGCEPVAVRSGRGWQDGMAQNVELRDDRVAFFVSYMRQGAAQLRYQLRCETPGIFTALPTQGGSMYVPEVKANSEDFKLSITD
jgi:alpha-2-macroglobulin